MTDYSFREPKSQVDFIPIQNCVLLKLSMKLTASAISSDQIPDKLKSVVTVAGYGENTYGFDIGDVVYLNNEYRKAAPFRIMLPSNKLSMEERYRQLNILTKEEVAIITKNRTKFLVEEYLVIPAYGMLGYIKSDKEDAKILLSLSDREPITRESIKDIINLAVENEIQKQEG